jgi:succinate dehydrogenase / fumarate reductase cytochrome b subunit
MSVSGIFLILFLLFHMSMNLALLFSAEAYDTICGLLGANWYAIAGTLILAAGVLVHVIYATILTLQNRKARGSDRYLAASKTDTEWSAKNMYILGIIIVLGLLLHLWNFWYKMQFAELTGIQTGEHLPHEGAAYVSELFSCPCYSVIYLIWLSALWLHLTHGVWSAFQTIGLSNRTWYPRWKIISYIVSTIIILGFAAVPVKFMLF